MRPAIAIIVSALLLAASTSAAPGAAPPAGPAVRPPVQPLTPDELAAAIKGGKWLIVEFGGERCIPCMQMQPILQDFQVALKGKATVHNFWIQEHPDVARRHRIIAMPTQVIFNPRGEEVFRHMGYFPPGEFQQALRQLGIL